MKTSRHLPVYSLLLAAVLPLLAFAASESPSLLLEKGIYAEEIERNLDSAIKTRYAAEPANVPAWLPLMYWRAMLNGSGKLGPLMNDRYPDIRPTGVREYVARLATERAPGGAH